MLAGRRALHRDTPIETLSAILREEPARVPPAARREAPGLVRLVLRCLERRPGDRFESARDLAFAIEAAADGGHAPATDAAPSPAVALAGPEIAFTRLRFQRGNILHARFTPDGHSVVFGGAWEGRPAEVFWMHLGSPEARSIGAPGSDLFGVSRTGELAVCLKRRFETGFSWSGTLGRMPLGGLVARPMLEDVEEADWGPGGQLAMVRDVRGMGRLEYPAGRVLFETPGWIGHARVSRDGRQVAFIHHEALASDGGKRLGRGPGGPRPRARPRLGHHPRSQLVGRRRLGVVHRAPRGGGAQPARRLPRGRTAHAPRGAGPAVHRGRASRRPRDPHPLDGAAGGHREVPRRAAGCWRCSRARPAAGRSG
jgi:hypothetical protein